MIEADETIVAIASPTDPAPRGVVRLSGPDVLSVLLSAQIEVANQRVANRFDAMLDLGDPLGVIPVGVLVWPNSRSYTGQPSAEIHALGSPVILSEIVRVMVAAGARAARPGEFTMRAFLAGRLDLTQAEAVLGVIDASHRGSLDHALEQLAGNLSRPLEHMRSEMLNLLADVEAGLDFVDEDIEFITDDALISRLEIVRGDLHKVVETMQRRGGGELRPVVVLRGLPNAGKSCLMNHLAGKESAIVADVAGTTRDFVLADATFNGHGITLVDTAGIEERDSEVSQRSQSQAAKASEKAIVRLWCADASRNDFTSVMSSLQERSEATRRASVTDLFVATKSDLLNATATGSQQATDLLLCSAVSGDGIASLKDAIVAAIDRDDREEVGSVLGTAARCSQSLRGAIQAIETAVSMTRGGDGHEFVAAELRIAVESLGEVTGAVYTDDILDRVFGRFCIGK